MAERKAFVCGHPIAHSRSPMIHSHWLRQFGIEGSYTAIDVEPARFGDFVKVGTPLALLTLLVVVLLVPWVFGM